MRAMPRVTKPVEVRAPAFEESAPATVRELQAALSDLVAELPGKVGRAVDLERALAVDRKLGWQIFTFVNAPDPLSEISNVPGAASMRKVLTAASRRRVARAVIERAARAFQRFEAFVSEQTADRSELMSLASGLTLDGDQQHEIKVRKGVFRGLAHVWGVQAATYIRTAVVHPSRAGPAGTDDVLVMIGYVGLQRLRRGVPLALNATVGVHNEPPAGGGERPVLPASDGAPAAQAIGQMEVLSEFSSRPLPEMVPRAEPDGTFETELVFPPSGRAGAVRLYTAQHIVAAWTGEQSQHCLNTVVKLPAETHVSELLVPAGTTDPGTARVGVYGRRGAVERVYDLRSVDLLPQRESITYLGTLEAPPPVPGVPNHSEAVRSSLRRLGWTDRAYDVYRCTVKYPVLHTMIRIAVVVRPGVGRR